MTQYACCICGETAIYSPVSPGERGPSWYCVKHYESEHWNKFLRSKYLPRDEVDPDTQMKKDLGIDEKEGYAG